MWLDVAASNNDPFNVCTNFADTVISLGGIHGYVIRADRGTENGNIEMMQTYLRIETPVPVARNVFIRQSNCKSENRGVVE